MGRVCSTHTPLAPACMPRLAAAAAAAAAQRLIATTPAPPYFAVIFTSLRQPGDGAYGRIAARMVELAEAQPGFLGIEAAREDVGITVSYWADLESIKAWKANSEHRQAQARGRSEWYSAFSVRIAEVKREYRL